MACDLELHFIYYYKIKYCMIFQTAAKLVNSYEMKKTGVATITACITWTEADIIVSVGDAKMAPQYLLPILGGSGTPVHNLMRNA